MVLVPLGPVVRVHHVRGEGVRGGGRGQRRQRPRLRRYPGRVPVYLTLQAGRVQEGGGGGEGEEKDEEEAGLKVIQITLQMKLGKVA